jgi:CDP-4-dehydro-6-deoxyglucose reductase
MTMLTLPQVGRRLPVADGHTFLDAALAAGIAYPHSCRSGRCGACKSKLIAGRVALGPHTLFALTHKEKADGFILACRAVPDGDATVAWLGDEETVGDFPVVAQEAVVTALVSLTHDIRGVRLRLADRDAFNFLPGQYIRFTIDGAPPRDYSIASRPDEAEIDLEVRGVPHGQTSSRIHYGLSVGDRVRVEGPFGSAFLRPAHDGPIFAVAGGSGLAPIRSIVESALRDAPDRAVRLYFGARAERDVYHAERIAELTARHPNFAWLPVLSGNDVSGWRHGRVSDALADDRPDVAGAKAYVAGPPAMVEAVAAALKSLGLAAADIHADVFFTPNTNDATLAKEETP